MEEILISCLDGPVSESHFALFRPQLRRDLPIAVSRHFLNSYRRLDAEAKYSLRSYLRAWIDDPEDGTLLVRPFRSDSRFKWIQLGSLATAVLSVSGPQPLWAALLRTTHQRASLVGAPPAKVSTTSKASARLRAYLDAI